MKNLTKFELITLLLIKDNFCKEVTLNNFKKLVYYRNGLDLTFHKNNYETYLLGLLKDILVKTRGEKYVCDVFLRDLNNNIHNINLEYLFDKYCVSLRCCLVGEFDEQLNDIYCNETIKIVDGVISSVTKESLGDDLFREEFEELIK